MPFSIYETHTSGYVMLCYALNAVRSVRGEERMWEGELSNRITLREQHFDFDFGLICRTRNHYNTAFREHPNTENIGINIIVAALNLHYYYIVYAASCNNMWPNLATKKSPVNSRNASYPWKSWCERKPTNYSRRVSENRPRTAEQRQTIQYTTTALVASAHFPPPGPLKCTCIWSDVRICFRSSAIVSIFYFFIIIY